MTRRRSPRGGASIESAGGHDKGKGTRPLLFAWQQAIRESDLDPTTKLVAFTVSTYMDIGGSSAHPGADRLARDVRLTVRTVRRHLRHLQRRGWLTIDERGGGRGRATLYRGTIPPTENGDTGDTVSTGNGDTGDRETVTRVTVNGVTGVTPPTQEQPNDQRDVFDPARVLTEGLTRNAGRAPNRGEVEALIAHCRLDLHLDDSKIIATLTDAVDHGDRFPSEVRKRLTVTQHDADGRLRRDDSDGKRSCPTCGDITFLPGSGRFDCRCERDRERARLAAAEASE